jgi:hypothetical protein
MGVSLETVQLHDEWAVDSHDYSQVTNWIACGDHVAGSTQGLVFCVSMYTGTEVVAGSFPYRLNDPFENRPAIAYGNGVLYFNDGTTLLAFDTVTGVAHAGWQSGISLPGLTSLQVIDGVVIAVYTGDAGQTLIGGFDPQTGAAQWPAYTVNQQSPGLVGLGDQAAYFVAGDQLVAVNVGSGAVRFSAAAVASGSSLDQVNAPLCIGEAIVCGGSAVFAFHYRTGKPLWQTPAGTGGWTVAQSESGFVVATGNGTVAKIRLADGSVVAQQTAPSGTAPMVITGTVYTIDPLFSLLSAFDQATLSPIAQYALPAPPSLAPLVANGALFVAGGDGRLHAMPFASQDAAYFDGAKTYFEIQPLKAAFDLELADFTIELWTRSSTGGEILCSYPQNGGGHGLRFNLGSDGSLQFAIANGDLSDADLWATDPTIAADGNWHHLSAVRASGAITLYVDGIAYTTKHAYRRAGAKVNPYFFEQAALCAPLALHGDNVLVGGAYKGSASSGLSDGFTGLMRELRIWTRALDAAKIASRMYQRLNFLTSDLLGNWHLDADWGQGAPQTQPLENDVQGFDFVGTCYNAWSCVSDFASDDSDYPFFLEKAALPWPYQSQSHWAVCGEDPISIAPVVGAAGTVCFGDDIALYGVEKSGGARRWGVQMPEGCSAPLADGNAFLTLSWEFGMLSIDAVTGAYQSVSAFSGVVPQDFDRTVPLCAPAGSISNLAAAGPDGTLWVKPRSSASAPFTYPTARGPQNLQLNGTTVAAFAGGIIYLASIGADGLTTLGNVAADGPFYYLDAQRIICIQAGAPVCYLFSTGFAKPSYAGTALDGTVTGMAASSDGSLLAVTTSGGVAYGLAIGNLGARWANAHAEPVPSPYFAPAFGNGYVVVTEKAGAVIALDAMTGESVARYAEPHAIVTGATVDNGTLYYGCAPEGADGLKDGALHSVALGGTYALRAGITGAGVRGYASVVAQTPVALYAQDQLSIEAWINTQAGGEIFTVLPNASGQTFYARLASDANGVVTFAYASRAAATDAWNGGTWTSVATGLADGTWHHLAVCMNGTTDVRLYVDAAKTATPGNVGPMPAVPAANAQSMVWMGASAPDASGNPTAFYNGMIAEIRLWDDYLTVAEISDRMNDKLVGDEPDLLAYWNFDAKMVHDSARNGFDGTLIGEDSDADYWLTNLAFTATSYPTISSSASMKSQDATGTTYALAVQTLKADQTPLPAAMTLWYVTNDPSQPSSIQIGLPDGTLTTLQAQAPGHDTDPATGFACTTASDGTISLLVVTTDTAAGPSLNLNAAFMYPNERYHLNTLVNNQNFTRPPSPSLVVQTKMLQDYSYVHGDSISEANHRNTFSVIVHAQNSDGSAMQNEAINIWADDTLSIEIGGVVYPINATNPASVVTDPSGDVAIVIEADDIHCPGLQVWAGFMPRDARIKVAPDQDGQNTLAGVHGGDLTATQNQEWTPSGTQTAAVLTGDYRDHSSDISETMRHLMAAGQSASSSNGKAALSALRSSRPLRARPSFADMTQPAPYLTVDVTPGRMAQARIARIAPLTPEFMLHSLAQAVPAGSPAPIGFHFACAGGIDSFSFSHIFSPAEFARITASGPAVPRVASNLGSIWDDIVDAADDVWDDVKEIAIQIGDTVTAAIKTADGWVTTAIGDIATACRAIGDFLEQLALEIVAIIKFLLTFFDWGAIKATAERLHSYSDQVATQVSAFVSSLDLGNAGVEAIAWLKEQVDALAGVSMEVDSVSQARAAYPASTGGGGSVQSAYAQKKLQQYGPQSDLALVASGGSAVQAFDEIALGIGKAITDLITAVPNVASMSLSDFAHLLGKVLADVVNPLLDGIADLVQLLANCLTDLVTEATEGFETPIEIPFLSELYKWIFGSSLSYGAVAGIVLAIPANVMAEICLQKAFTDIGPETLPALFPAAGALAAPEGGETWQDDVYMITGMIIGPLQAFSDVFQMARIGANSVEPPTAPEFLCNIALGILSAPNAFFKSNSSDYVRAVSYLLGLGKALYTFQKFEEGVPAGPMSWGDKGLLLFQSLVGIIAVIVTFTADSGVSAGAKAASVLTSIPQIDRPCILAGDNPYAMAALAFLDYSTITSAALIVGTGSAD